jgi:hypothetical protein
MPRRRPGSPWLRGAVACALVLVLPACGDNPVRIDAPGLDAADRETCEALVDDLPDKLYDQERRLVAPAASRGAAWGDPPIVLVCGVDEPEEYDEYSLCIEANGVGWFVPPSQEEDGVDVTITTVGHLPRVAVTIPGDYRPNGLASVMASLSSVVEEHLELVDPCL